MTPEWKIFSGIKVMDEFILIQREALLKLGHKFLKILWLFLWFINSFWYKYLFSLGLKFFLLVSEFLVSPLLIVRRWVRICDQISDFKAFAFFFLECLTRRFPKCKCVLSVHYSNNVLLFGHLMYFSRFLTFKIIFRRFKLLFIFFKSFLTYF